MKRRFTIAAAFIFTATLAWAAGVDKAAMDTATPPGQDFWQYANGTWVKAHPIPADRSSYGIGAVLGEEANKRTVDLIQNAARGAKPGTDAQRVGDYYESFMDEAGIEAKGTAPLKPIFDKIAAIADRTSLAHYLGEGLRADVDLMNATDLYTDNIFGLWISPPFDKPGKYEPYLMQGGLGMPDREYYLSNSEAMKKARAAYVGYIAAMLKHAGIPDADAKAKRIMALELKIAATHASVEDTFDMKKINNEWARADFATKAPGLDWSAYFAAAGLDKAPRFMVVHPLALTGVAKLATSESLDDWKDYLTFRAIDHFGDYLPKAFAAERFAFYGKALQGTPQIRDRWKRAVDATNEAVGEVVGKLYVAKYFPAAAKAQLETMVANLVAAYSKRIDALDWMAASTKAEAKRKLAVLKVGIAYPDRWRDYSAFTVVRGDAFGNLQRSEEFEYRFRRARLGQAVDRGEWVMTPQVVNAVNLPMLNALNFPAGILQAPYFDPNAPAASNYGSIGAVIGHEISHSFDDFGSQFDSTGRLHNWWTDADLKQFKAAGAALADQYDAYKPFPDLGVNGKQTLSENIADLAGLAASYDAYRASLGGKGPPVISGLTGGQQFFLAYAQSWSGYMRDEALRQRLVTDGHAPARYRALTVRNLDPWYAAFPIKQSDALSLAPDKRVKVW